MELLELPDELEAAPPVTAVVDVDELSSPARPKHIVHRITDWDAGHYNKTAIYTCATQPQQVTRCHQLLCSNQLLDPTCVATQSGMKGGGFDVLTAGRSAASCRAVP